MPSFEGPYPRAREAFPTLRQSLLSSFNDCARSSKYEIDYRNGWSSHPQARGQIFHKFAAECLREMARMGEQQIPTDAAQAIMREVIRQDDADRECRFCGSTKIKKGVTRDGMRHCLTCKKTFATQFVNIPIAQIKDLVWVSVKWAHDSTFPINYLIDVERRLEAKLFYPDRVHGGSVPRVLTGALDAMFLDAADDTHGIVYDWKDTWAMPPEAVEGGRQTVSDDGFFQQRFYAMLLFANYPSLQRVTLREWYVRYSDFREASLHRNQIEEITAELAALAERFDRAYEEGLWVATPGKHCNVCTRPSDCPVPIFARGDGRITDPARAERVAASLLVAEKVVKDNRQALRAYSEVHGPIPIKDAKGRRAFGFVTKQRTERPKLEEIEKAEIENGGPLSSEQLRAMFRTRTSTKFEAYTPDPEAEAKQDAEAAKQLESALVASIEAAAEGRARVGEEAA